MNQKIKGAIIGGDLMIRILRQGQQRNRRCG